MPYDPTIEDYLARIAAERLVSRSAARRILIEQIDLAKREKLVRPGVRDRQRNQVSTDNSQRVFIKDPGSRPKKPPKLSEKQKAGLKKRWNDPLRRVTAEPEPVKTPDSGSGTPTRVHLGGKNPVPGTQAAIIVGVLRDEDGDFINAFIRLRAMGTFQHYNDSQLRQRMHECVYRYRLNLPGAAVEAV